MASMLAIATVLLAEVGWIQHERTAASQARQRLESVTRELRTLSVSHPSPTSENVAALARTLEEAASQRGELLARIDREAWEVGASSVEPADAYFALVDFAERMRARAVEQGIALQRGERFGFARYATTGPKPDEIPMVMRDRWALTRLLTTLFEARPQELLFVQRERSAGAEEGTFDPRDTEMLRREGFAEGRAFRVGFRAGTETLRVWLNELSRGPELLVVRAVDVAKEEPAVRAAAADNAEPGKRRPVVAEAWARFTVTVEYLVPATTGGAST